MSSEQLELQPQPQPPSCERVPAQEGAPSVSVQDLATLMARLRGRSWRTAADLGAGNERDKRKLRAVCRESAGRIISGPMGYRLTAEVSAEDFTRCRGRLQSFVDDIKAHIAELDVVWFEQENSRKNAGGAEAQSQ